MTPLACITHWYVSMLYVVPVAAVGGWGWWSARRNSRAKRTAPRTSARGPGEAPLERRLQP